LFLRHQIVTVIGLLFSIADFVPVIAVSTTKTLIFTSGPRRNTSFHTGSLRLQCKQAISFGARTGAQNLAPFRDLLSHSAEIIWKKVSWKFNVFGVFRKAPSIWFLALAEMRGLFAEGV
jgi:hypothetical protein